MAMAFFPSDTGASPGLYQAYLLYVSGKLPFALYQAYLLYVSGKLPFAALMALASRSLFQRTRPSRR
jgi:hypothetical protein